MPYLVKKGRVGRQIKPFIILLFLLVLATSTVNAAFDDAELYYSFDDDNITGQNPLDISAYSNDGTEVGSVTSGAAGHFNEGFDLNGDNANYITIPTTVISGTKTSWTVNMWVDPDAFGGKSVPYSASGDTKHLIFFSATTTIQAGFDAADGLIAFTVPNYATGYHMVTVTCDGSDIRVYLDGTESSTGEQASAGCEWLDQVYQIGRYASTDGFNYDGRIDELSLYDYTFTDTQVSDYYALTQNPYGSAAVGVNPYIFVSAYDYYNNESISSFTATLNNGTSYTTTNGTAKINNLTIGNYTFNVTYSDYFNTTNNIIVEAAENNTYYEENVYPYQSVINFSAYKVISNDSIMGVTFYVNGTVGTTPFNLPEANNYVLTAEKAGYFNQTQTFNVTALDNKTINIYDMFDASVTISPRDILNNNTISNANITLANSTYSFSSTFNGVSNATFNVTTGIYLLTITQDNHTSYAENITISGTGEDNIYAYMYAYNSLWVYAYNQDTSASIIIFNVTVQNDNYSYTAAGAGGITRINDIVSGEYDVTVAATGYSSSTYVVTMTDNSHQNLNAYLSVATDTFIFTVKDKSTNDLIEGATITQRRFINGTLTTIESKSTDITGRVQFTFVNGVKYTFIASDDDYETKSFNLEILFDDYTLFLTPEVTGNTTVFYDDVYVAINDYKLLNNYTDWVEVNFVSNSGTLEGYFVNVTLPNGTTYSVSGSNSGGAYLNNSFFVSDIMFGQSALITYGYKSTLNIGYKILTRV